MNILENISALVFDLGEVIVNVDTKKTTDAFAFLAGDKGFELYSFHQQSTLFNDFERGKIDAATFRNGLRPYFNPAVEDAQIDSAWNAMLGDTPLRKLQILQGLRKQYKVFALSNTNIIHIAWVNAYLKSTYDCGCLEDYFDKAYYSYEIGERKPDAASFQIVLNEQHLIPEKTLMIDDRLENLNAAAALGMKTYHMQHPDEFYGLFG